MNSDQIDQLHAKFPARLQHIHLISRLLNPSLPSPPSLFLHDVNSPSHTFSLLSSILRDLILQSNKLNPDPSDLQDLQDSQSDIEQDLDDSSSLEWKPSKNRLLTINLSPLTHPTSRSIYSQILQDLNTHFQSTDDDDGMELQNPISSKSKGKGPPYLVPADDSLGAFIRSLRLALERIESGKSSSKVLNGTTSHDNTQDRKFKLVIVVRDAERIRDMWQEHVCEGLGKLDELLDRHGMITLILISSIPPAQFRTASGGFNASSTLASPFVIRFTGIGQKSTLKTLHLLYPQLEKSFQIQSLSYPETSLRKQYSTKQSFSSALRKLFEGLCQYVYDTFSTEVRSLDEKEILTCALWHVLSVIVHLGAVPNLNFTSYASYLSSFGRDALDVLVPRRLGIREWIAISRSEMTELIFRKKPEIRAKMEEFRKNSKESSRVGGKRDREDSSKVDSEESQRKRVRATNLNLPLLPSYLLIAAFLASFLKSSKDPSLFLRSNEGMAGNVKKGGGAKKSRKPGDGEEERDDLKRASLVGPKIFPLERLLSILQSILSENSPKLGSSSESDINYTFEFEEDFGADEKELMSEWKSKMEKWNTADQAEEVWGRKIRSASTFKTISILISRRLIQRSSASEKLDSMNLRCNIGYAEARLLAKRVGFELENYMSSW